jgi:hypothetical protein
MTDAILIPSSLTELRVTCAVAGQLGMGVGRGFVSHVVSFVRIRRNQSRMAETLILELVFTNVRSRDHWDSRSSRLYSVQIFNSWFVLSPGITEDAVHLIKTNTGEVLYMYVCLRIWCMLLLPDLNEIRNMSTDVSKNSKYEIWNDP